MQASKLNQTFIPKQIIKKTSIINQNAMLSANQFEKTGGNLYIQFDPVEVKFNGYQLGKTQSAIVKIINKSPIPQRIHVLPPTQSGFSVKVNKKGPIAAGMSENVVINFTSDVYKYQYDVVKVNSETCNFVIPIYAYPSIPKINQIFPKIIDFGSINVNQSNSYIYPIVNPIPMDFTYQFKYLQESSAFIITPIRNTIASNSTQNIQITFIPSDKRTFTAQVVFVINQFDFQPIRIKILGSGQQKKDILTSTRRIKSSKLNPLQKNDSKKLQSIIPSIPEPQSKALDLGFTSQKKSFIRSRTSYPKLLKKATGTINQIGQTSQLDKLQISIKKQGQRDYNHTYSKIQQLDKQKQIKFIQYLGNRAMTQEQTQFQHKIVDQTQKNRQQNFKQFCFNRHQPQLKNDGEVDLTKFTMQPLTWDTHKNNQLKIRKQKLQIFMKAGSKIITKYRLVKRLGKIRQFLKDCKNKQDVRKKVQEDYAKSKDLAKQGKSKTHGKFTFGIDMLGAKSFPLQFKDQTQSVKRLFQPEGSTKFDDDKILDEIKPHQTQRLGYGNLQYPSDYIYMTKVIPPARQSAQQQYPLKTASLPNYTSIVPSKVYKLPLKVPTHQFIHNNFQITRYKTPNAVDQKDPQYIIDATLQHVQDQFEGWSKGDMDVLKTKFMRNLGCEFSGVSLYSYPEYGDIGFIGQLGSHLPHQIGNMQITKDDILEQGDSDQQKLPNTQIQKSETLFTKIQQNNAKLKQRRQKKQIQNYEGMLLSTIDKNLQKIKYKNITQAIDKISEYNKWVDKKFNKIMI